MLTNLSDRFLFAFAALQRFQNRFYKKCFNIVNNFFFESVFLERSVQKIVCVIHPCELLFVFEKIVDKPIVAGKIEFLAILFVVV